MTKSSSTSPPSIPINPGGTLDPRFVVARDELIERFWEILEQQSLALLAPRRVGKTSVCRRMEANPPPGFVTVWRDLEGLHSGEQFVARLFEDCEDLLSHVSRAKRGARKVLEAITGTVELKGFKFNLAPEDWARVLDAIFADLQAAAEKTESRTVLFWDEFTWFLSDLIEHGHSEHATTLLDRLRAARQEHPRLRMVFTGSIGLRTVLSRLESDGYGNQPMNDVSRQVVPLLDRGGAEELGRALLANIEDQVGDRAELVSHLAQVTEGHPLLLHSVAQKLKFAGVVSLQGIDEALEELLEEDTDPLELSYWARRLAKYLDQETAAGVLGLLDALAPHADGLELPALQAAVPELDRERLLLAIDLLRRDQYVVRTGRHLRFRLDFLRRYWCLERMLEPA